MKIFQSIIALLLILFSLTGSDCEKTLLNGGPVVPQELVGNWKLIEQTGALQDICEDESVNFQSDGIALLTCPNSESISRNFNVENDVLTYTQSSISYGIETLSGDTLYLLGQNVSRNLLYQKIITGNNMKSSVEKNKFNNSSEFKR